MDVRIWVMANIFHFTATFFFSFFFFFFLGGGGGGGGGGINEMMHDMQLKRDEVVMEIGQHQLTHLFEDLLARYFAQINWSTSTCSLRPATRRVYKVGLVHLEFNCRIINIYTPYSRCPITKRN